MLNTLSFARKLSKSGVEREHAEAIANAVSDALEQQNGTLATKDFVHDMVSELRGEVSELRSEVSELRGEVSELRGDMNAKINELRGDMNTKISELRGDMNTKISDVRGEISASEARIVRWIVGTGIAIISLMIADGTLF